MPSNVITLQIGGAIDLNLRVAPEGYVKITARYGEFVVTSKGDKVAYTLQVGRYIDVQVSYVDTGGNPASVDGEVTWDTNNENIVTVESGADSTMCKVSAVNDTGDCQVTATVDADLGTGMRELITILDLHVVSGEAVAGTINIVGESQPI